MTGMTQRDLVETITGLQQLTRELQEVATGRTLEGYKIATVAARVSFLTNSASYLEQVTSELLTLIPNTPVEVPQDPATT